MSAASDYEYRDIAMESVDAAGESGRGRRRRILVDTDFRAQFEIPPLRQQHTTNLVSQQHNNKTGQCPAAAERAAVQDFPRDKKGQDLKFTNEMEILLFQSKTDHHSMSEMMMMMMMMRGIMKNEITSSQRPMTNKHCYVKKQDQEDSEPTDEGVFGRGANLLHKLLAVCDQAKTNHDYNISVEEIDNTARQPGSDAQSFRQA
ncbi:unnamed protein product [Sphagnum tenellum]